MHHGHTQSGEAILFDDEGNATKIDVAECPGGCAFDGICGTEHLCHSHEVTGVMFLAILSILTIAAISCCCCKRK